MVFYPEILEYVDYRAEDAIRLLNQFPGIETRMCCAGHIQDGISGYYAMAIRYVPGLSIKNGSYYLDGKPVDRERLHIDGFHSSHSFSYLPFEQIFSVKEIHRLIFTGSYLDFELWEGYEGLFKKLVKLYEMLGDLNLSYDKNGFGIPALEYTEAYIGGTSVDAWKPYISRLKLVQTKTDQLWRDIASICKDEK